MDFRRMVRRADRGGHAMAAALGSDRPLIRIDLLATPLASGSCLYGLYDILSSAGIVWGQVMPGSPCRPMLDVRIVALGGRPFRCVGGVPVVPQAAAGEGLVPSVICVPDLHVPPHAGLAGRLPEEVSWLRHAHLGGAVLCSVCSGALLLAETGLLDGQEATTHWAFADTMRRQYPRVRLRPERVLVQAGEGHRVVTAGGAASWGDLALYLIARFCGEAEAIRCAKVHLLAGHQEGQLPYAAMARNLQHADPVISRCQDWIAAHYSDPNPVAAMLALTGLPERTFTRRFKAATGFTPLDYVQTLRVEEAKQMLESGAESIDAIGHAVGYEDAAFFRRLFKRRTGLTPKDYRRRFHHVTGLRRVETGRALSA